MTCQPLDSRDIGAGIQQVADGGAPQVVRAEDFHSPSVETLSARRWGRSGSRAVRRMLVERGWTDFSPLKPSLHSRAPVLCSAGLTAIGHLAASDDLVPVT